jgi:hypothetical protein
MTIVAKTRREMSKAIRLRRDASGGVVAENFALIALLAFLFSAAVIVGDLRVGVRRL